MSKLIAVWGSPCSGKTTLTLKLAEALYSRKRGLAVTVLFTDSFTPTIPVLFPNFKSEEVFSVGTVLSRTDITADDVVSNIVMTKERANLGYLGYKDGENKYSYPSYNAEKVKELFAVLSGISDYVIADCMTFPELNLMTEVALANADSIVTVTTPDLKCLSYSQSQSPIAMMNQNLAEKQVKVMNVTEQVLSMPVSDAAAHLGKIVGTVPFSVSLKEQYLEGRLYEPTKDKRYMTAIKAIADKVV